MDLLNLMISPVTKFLLGLKFSHCELAALCFVTVWIIIVIMFSLVKNLCYLFVIFCAGHSWSQLKDIIFLHTKQTQAWKLMDIQGLILTIHPT